MPPRSPACARPPERARSAGRPGCWRRSGRRRARGAAPARRDPRPGWRGCGRPRRLARMFSRATSTERASRSVASDPRARQGAGDGDGQHAGPVPRSRTLAKAAAASGGRAPSGSRTSWHGAPCRRLRRPRSRWRWAPAGCGRGHGCRERRSGRRPRAAGPPATSPPN